MKYYVIILSNMGVILNIAVTTVIFRRAIVCTVKEMILHFLGGVS